MIEIDLFYYLKTHSNIEIKRNLYLNFKKDFHSALNDTVTKMS